MPMATAHMSGDTSSGEKITSQTASALLWKVRLFQPRSNRTTPCFNQ